MNGPENHKFIFLCGLHKSGTSPLFKILREHRDIAGFRDTGVPEDEGQHLQSVFATAKVWGGPGRFGFAAEAHLTEESPLNTSRNKQKLFDEWSRYWDLDKRYLLEKSPPNLIKTRFLQAVFADSYFVVIMRHPVVVSLATLKWSGSSLDELLEHWVYCHRLFRKDCPHLRRVRIVKYEDLICATDRELAGIYAFLGLEKQPVAPLAPSGNDLYFRAWQQLLELPGRQRALREIIEKYEEQVKSFDYSLIDCPLAEPTSGAFEKGLEVGHLKLTKHSL